MDGTYNNPYAQGQSQSPLSPQTPGGYQVNVNRTKTRKWVQAPTQNYDGDDWGADEFEDDEPPPPPPVPRVSDRSDNEPNHLGPPQDWLPLSLPVLVAQATRLRYSFRQTIRMHSTQATQNNLIMFRRRFQEELDHLLLCLQALDLRRRPVIINSPTYDRLPRRAPQVPLLVVRLQSDPIFAI
ncbi:hypothetical protein LB503_012963 [Fusarium chuoi]|nr:hypothetical protein LB503_012963 [Fusarium chuoi]